MHSKYIALERDWPAHVYFSAERTFNAACSQSRLCACRARELQNAFSRQGIVTMASLFSLGAHATAFRFTIWLVACQASSRILGWYASSASSNSHKEKINFRHTGSVPPACVCLSLPACGLCGLLCSWNLFRELFQVRLHTDTRARDCSTILLMQRRFSPLFRECSIIVLMYRHLVTIYRTNTAASPRYRNKKNREYKLDAVTLFPYLFFIHPYTTYLQVSSVDKFLRLIV